MWLSWYELVVDLLLGMFASAYGTLIGAGGGFIMSPILILAPIYNLAPKVAAATSLTAVVFNAATAVHAYTRQKRIDYFTGLRFELATVPSAILGTLIVGAIPERAFKAIFGLLLILIAGYMAVRGERPAGRPAGFEVDAAVLAAEGKTVRTVTDAHGRRFIFGYRMSHGLLLSAGVGILSSLLGVGGGIMMTPVMISLFGIPAHIAVATAQFILLISAATGAASYLLQGAVDVPTAIGLGLGGIVGARIGAAIAHRVHGKLIVRLLAVALLLVGMRLLAASLGL